MTSMENKKRYKATKAGRIPEEWQALPLSKLINRLETGVSVVGENRSARIGEKGVLKVSSVSYGVFNPEEIKIVSDENIERLKTAPKKGSILISRANTPDLVGATAFVYETYDNVYLPDKIWQTVFKKEIEVDPLYVFFSLKGDRNKYKISNLATGSSGSMKNISKPSFLSLYIPLPPLPEQQKIATILSTWDKAIDSMTALIDAKEEQKKGLMQRLLTGKVRLKGFIENWTETSLGHHFKLNTEKVIHEIDLPVFTSSHKGLMLQSEYYDTSRITNKTIVGNNVLPPKYFTYRSRSDSGFFKFNRNDTSYCGCISKYYPVFIPKGSDSQFMFFFLNYFSSRFRAFASGTSQLVLSFNQFCKVKFKIPSPSEQHEIGVLLNVMENTIILLKQRKEQLELERKGLMQQLLTGKTRVKLN